MYNTLYRAKVTGLVSSNSKIGPGKVAKYCADDQSKCVTGPRQPMYVFQKE